MGVSIYSGKSFADITVVIDKNGKKILGYNNCGYFLAYSKAGALIQSEINDGDNDSIELTGNYEENTFKIKSVKANGYKIDF